MNTKTIWLGCAMALFSAAAFAMNMTLAGVSYQYGANIHALNFARAELFLFCLLVVVFLKGSNLLMPVRAWGMCVVVGVLLCSLMYCLLGAVQYIPVALAVLMFYTYPIMIAVFRWVRKEEAFSYKSVGLLVLAFAGLCLVLLDSAVQLELKGMLYAAAGGVVMAAMLITSEKNLNQYDNFVVLVYTLATVMSILVVLAVLFVDHEWPVNEQGWTAFAGSTIFYVLATFTLFKAVSLVGPLRTAIVDNSAPIWAMLFAYLMLGESFSSIQSAGALLVIGAIIVLQLISQPAKTELT